MKGFLLIFIFCTPLILISQIGSNSSYNSLNLNSSSRVLSMGGEVISVVDNDVSLANMNPSLLNSSMSRQIAFNFVDYVSDINFISFHTSKQISENFFLFTGIDAINSPPIIICLNIFLAAVSSFISTSLVSGL